MRRGTFAANVSDADLLRRDDHAKVPGAGKHDATLVGLASGHFAGRVTRLRTFLIDDAVKVLPGVEVVVAVKHDIYVVGYRQLVDWHCPAGTLLPEDRLTVGVCAAPFVKRRGFGAPAAVIVGNN